MFPYHAVRLHEEGLAKLVDTEFYQDRYEDVPRDQPSIIRHYVEIGAFEGRQPSESVPWWLPRLVNEVEIEDGVEASIPIFNSKSETSDGLNLLLLTFTPDWYRLHYGLKGACDPLFHYLDRGWQEGNYPSLRILEWDYQYRYNVETEVVQHYYWHGLNAGYNLVSPHRMTRVSEDEHLIAEFNQQFGQVSLSSLKAMSVDLWDTLILRDRHPDTPKWNTCVELFQRLPADVQSKWTIERLLRRRMEIERELHYELRSTAGGEYTLRQVLQRLCLECDMSENVVSTLHSLELHDESTNGAANHHAMDIIERALESDVKVSILSDFYFDSDSLRLIVNAHLPRRLADAVEVYSSASLGSSKREGTAFEAIAGDDDLTDWVHFGDNVSSDFTVPRSLGCNAFLYPTLSRAGSRWSHSFFEMRSQERDCPNAETFARILRESSRGLVSAEIAKRQDLRELVRDESDFDGIFNLALLTTSYLILLGRAAKARDAAEIWFLSSEGAFLARIFERLNLGGSNLTFKHVKESRKSLFLASRQEWSPEECASLWLMYPNQTPREFVSSLAIPKHLEDKLLDRLDQSVPLDVEIASIRTDRGFLESVFAPDLVDEINQEILEVRRSRLESLDPTRDGLILLSDVGWRGSMQSYLGSIFKDVNFEGLYIGLFSPMGSDSHHDCSKRSGLIFDFNIPGMEPSWDVHPVAALEFFLSLNSSEPAPDAICLLRDVQAAIEEQAPELSRTMGTMSDETLVELGRHAYSMFQNSPGAILSSAFFDGNHVESFGVPNRTVERTLRGPKLVDLWIERRNCRGPQPENGELWWEACLSLPGLRDLHLDSHPWTGN